MDMCRSTQARPRMVTVRSHRRLVLPEEDSKPPAVVFERSDGGVLAVDVVYQRRKLRPDMRVEIAALEHHGRFVALNLVERQRLLVREALIRGLVDEVPRRHESIGVV